jgi:nicotinate dehydrogenase subunit B
MTAQGQRRRLDHWIRIDREGSVTAFSGKVEIGQGITTALAQIVADELDVSIECVRLAPVDTSYSPDEGVTAGSMSIEQSGQKLRHIAAELRGLLLNRAAARLGTNVATLAVVDGVIRTPDGAGMTYGELVDDELLARDATSGFPPKISAARSLIGGRVPRVDLVSKVAGRRSYVQDLALPSMLHGRVVRPPSQAANLTFIDEDEVRRLPGVIALVRDRNFLAIIAQGEYEAVRALARARQIALWEEPSAFPLSTDPRYLLTALSEDNVAVDRRDEGALARRQRTLSATYSRPFIAHGALAPSCAVALLEDERYTVWTHSQGVYPLRHELGKVLEVLPETVRVIHMEGAGCYGHNGADDAALDAALLARAVPGRAVRVQWMRDDEFAWEPYGTAAVLRLSAALDEKGEIVDWTLDVWGHGHGSRPNPSLPDDTTSLLAGQHLARRFRPAVAPRAGSLTMGALRNAESIYRLRNQRVVDHHVPRSPIRVSALRSRPISGSLASGARSTPGWR